MKRSKAKIQPTCHSLVPHVVNGGLLSCVITAKNKNNNQKKGRTAKDPEMAFVSEARIVTYKNQV